METKVVEQTKVEAAEVRVSTSESATDHATANTRPPPILCLGIAKTGSASLAAALRILGLNKVHHGTEIIGDEFIPMWRLLGHAADATFDNLPTYTGTPFTREQWDEVFGEYDAVTDVASFYAMSLIRAYPEARVILVERDIEEWLKSATAVFAPPASRLQHWLVQTVEGRTGSVAGGVSMKFRMGWTRAREPADCLTNMRESYIRHYKEIREAVPKEQLLDLKLADGWAPLCEFLGKKVPEVPFPHVNDAKEYRAHEKRARDLELKKLARSIFSR